ncbi:DoxX-like family protein [Lentisphaera profundi]|uniref:DoxX-like family protein n=1 Tax=Lentisphaera profundi TaxID=1658616 RepID=A0ABY7VUB3_9BACT|nr:DoxX-like family protein [Lentisphaera profundi]WDE97652.1 DoxX-like family protein [Lentisphaera profundi]
MNQKAIYRCSRISLALIFLYHGIVPKLIFKSEQEVLMNNTFMPFLEKNMALMSSGIMETIYGFALLIFFHKAKLVYPAIFFTFFATIAILIQIPSLMTHAFNPFSTNLAVCALAYICLLSKK